MLDDVEDMKVAPVEEKVDNRPKVHFSGIIRYGQPNFEITKKPDHEGHSKYDPPLGKKGVTQARATGKFLEQYFKDNFQKFDKFIVETSPFLRCMMTSNHITKILGGFSVTINYRSSDALLKEVYSRDPISELEKNQYRESHYFKFFNDRKPEDIGIMTSEKHFSKLISFREPLEPADFKKEILTTYPE